jgi:DNA-binding beta-propeller fold protein YncE
MKPVTVWTAFAIACSLGAHAQTMKVITKYPIAGADGFDYISIDSKAHRLYVSHGVRVNVLDAQTGAAAGTIEDTPGAHGIAIASKLGHGFTSNGKEDKVTMFDLSTLAVIKKIDVGGGPDGIYYNGDTQRVFTNNHKSHDISAMDASTGKVVGTVHVEGNGEGAATGKDSLIYVALEDKNEVAAFDPKTLEVKKHFALDGVEAPTGLAIDKKTDRIFVGGHNKTMLVLDGSTGKKIASLPTGAGTDAAGFDGKNGLIFFSNGEGNITVFQEKSANEYVALDPVVTQTSAKTMVFDKESGKIFLPAAKMEEVPPTDTSQKPKKKVVDGTFCVLVVGKA